jgi:hypothetical protein
METEIAAEPRVMTVVGVDDIDLLLVDNAGARRQWRAYQLQSIVSELPEYDISSDEIIMSGFRDVWSEIRKDCFRSLEKVSDSVPVLASRRLSATAAAAAADNDSSWQTVHGGLLCLRAVFSGLSGEQVVAYSEELNLDRLLVSLIAHAQLTVRDAATQCLQAFGYLNSKSFVEKIMARLNIILLSAASMSSSYEHETEGLLMLLRKFIEAPTDSFDENFSVQVLKVLADHMHSASSIIRQLSAQTLLLAYKRSPELVAPDKLTDSIRHQIHSIVSNGLVMAKPTDDTSDPHWECLEAILILVEDILQYSTLQFLEAHQCSSDALIWPRFSDGKQSSFFGLIGLVPRMQLALAACIFHSRFEIRRMAGQLTPVLVIFAVVFSSLDPDALMLKAFDEASVSDVVLGHARSRSIVAQSMNCLLSSEVAKTVQLLLEATTSSCEDPFPRSNVEGTYLSVLVSDWYCCNEVVESLLAGTVQLQLSSLLTISPADLNQWVIWGQHTTGRLAEVEARKMFLAALKGSINAANDNRATMLSALNHGVRMLISLPLTEHGSGTDNMHFANSTGTGLVLCDFVEAAVLRTATLALYCCRFSEAHLADEARKSTDLRGLGLHRYLAAVQLSEADDVCSPSKRTSDRINPQASFDIVKQRLFPMEMYEELVTSNGTAVVNEELILPFLRDPSTNPLRLLASLSGQYLESSANVAVLDADCSLSNCDRAISGLHVSRYVCEAISPALSSLISLSTIESMNIETLQGLLQIVAAWIKASSRHHAWLDGMQFGMRSLHNSFWLLCIKYSKAVRDSNVYSESLNEVISDVLAAVKNNKFLPFNSHVAIAKGIALLKLIRREDTKGGSSGWTTHTPVLSEWLKSVNISEMNRNGVAAATMKSLVVSSEDEFSDWDAESDADENGEDENVQRYSRSSLNAASDIVPILEFMIGNTCLYGKL